MNDCVICKIAAGEIPALVVYEDAEVLGFLPLVMDAYGHTVIAPKAHHADLLTSPDAAIALVMTCAKALAFKYKNLLGATGFNLLHASGLSAQQSVPHLHFHLLPRYDNDGLNAWPAFPAIPHDRAELMERLRLKADEATP